MSLLGSPQKKGRTLQPLRELHYFFSGGSHTPWRWTGHGMGPEPPPPRKNPEVTLVLASKEQDGGSLHTACTRVEPGAVMHLLLAENPGQLSLRLHPNYGSAESHVTSQKSG